MQGRRRHVWNLDLLHLLKAIPIRIITLIRGLDTD
ncbi:unnamed protein product [Brassica oleracea]|uniref:(rape) hypothetical protein n=1 Tax=Brassica napus TaxID=3708 RepID=A0A816N427_BRANA|nr:unnamed protein product [Brassica napus]